MKFISILFCLISLNLLAQDTILQKSISHKRVLDILDNLLLKNDKSFILIPNEIINSEVELYYKKSKLQIEKNYNSNQLINFIEFEEITTSENKSTVIFNINSVYIIFIEYSLNNSEWLYENINIIDNR